jgi:hypothetical protein
MTSRPPTEPLSRATRLIAAAVIAIAALGITFIADRWLRHGAELMAPPPDR